MGIKSKFKKIGIHNVENLDVLKVHIISNNVVNKIYDTFPEHYLNRTQLLDLVSTVSMYTAEMPQDMSGAKYMFKNNSIFFNQNLTLDEMSTVAVHEFIHCIQYAYSPSKSNIGLCYLRSNFGLAINEAAVPLMASEANNCKPTQETYYGISINTISPNYYPLECALVEQLAYFTGTYPLYNSTLFCNDIFKNVLNVKIKENIYNTIVESLDRLLSIENNLNYFINELQTCNNPKSIKSLNNLVNKSKFEITNTFFKTQNLIITSFFNSEYNNIHNLEDVTNFNKKIYNFKDLIGSSDNYNFYNEFYIEMMNQVQNKKSYIEQYGEINLYEEINTSLMIVDKNKNLLPFINKFVSKLKKLVRLNKNTEEEINFWK